MSDKFASKQRSAGVDIDLQRQRDEAFFEDWTAWDSLDDLPMPDKRHGYFLQWPSNHHRFFCILRKYVDWIGGPAFEVALPPNDPIHRRIKDVPGLRQHPGLLGSKRSMYMRMGSTFFVPAEHWRELREALPAIKAATVKWARTPR